MTLEIRPAEPPDGPEAGRVGYAAWLKGIFPIVPEAARKRVSEASFAAFVRHMPQQVFIAELDGRIAGLGGTETGDNHISDIWVGPEHEGRGVGTALVRALEARILARGHRRATISVLSENLRALSLYRHLGYRILSEGLQYDAPLDCDLATTFLERDLTVD